MKERLDDHEDGRSHPPRKASPRVCRYCGMEISEYAKVCHHCHSNQNVLLANLNRFALLISFGLLILTAMQLL
jgi:hypothetical protein